MQIINDIRESVNQSIIGSLFNYGRNYDTALASAKLEVDNYFIHLDPLEFSGVINETETANVNIGFLLQDKPDSEYDSETNLDISDSIEDIQDNCKIKCLEWLNYFADNYKYQVVNYSITPATRIKNVMSGVLLTFSVTYKPSC